MSVASSTSVASSISERESHFATWIQGNFQPRLNAEQISGAKLFFATHLETIAKWCNENNEGKMIPYRYYATAFFLKTIIWKYY